MLNVSAAFINHFNIPRRIFRTSSNIYDGTFLGGKQLTAKLFSQKGCIIDGQDTKCASDIHHITCLFLTLNSYLNDDKTK